jgi:sulfide:quinone oxidoreductase
VAEIDPEANVVVTASGQRLAYDFLIVATGLELDYGAIEGMDIELIGKDGIGSVYAGPGGGAATWRREMSAFADSGGVGLFGRPGDRDEVRGRAAQIRLHHRGHPPPPRQPQQGRVYLAHTTRPLFACRSWPRRCACSMPSAASNVATSTS